MQKIIKLTSWDIGFERTGETAELLTSLRYFDVVPSILLETHCWCNIWTLSDDFSCVGVEGGVDKGVELLEYSDDANDDVSDGNVASVQYEPSDSPSLLEKKTKWIYYKAMTHK